MQALWKQLQSLPWNEYLILGFKRLSLALLVLLVGLWLARRLSNLLRGLLKGFDVDSMLGDFLRNIAFFILSVLVIVGALDQLGVPTTSLFAALGAAGLAIGLALKDSLSNIAGGVMLILLKPFRTGDTVSLGGFTGRVEHLRLLHTVLVTAENCELVLPNNRVSNESILNFSARPTRRIDLLIGLAHKQDLASAFAHMREICSNDNRVLNDPAPSFEVQAINDSNLQLAMKVWVKTSDFMIVRSDLLAAVKSEFERANIEFPMAAAPPSKASVSTVIAP